MCIRVRYAPLARLKEPWDAEQNLITLPSELLHEFALRALRAVLSELAVEQPELGARCWCGDPIGLLPRIPNQRQTDEVMRLGA